MMVSYNLFTLPEASLLPTCVYSVVGLQVGKFVIGLLTVTVVAAEWLLSWLELEAGLLSRGTGGVLKDSWSIVGHLWENHRSLEGCLVQLQRTLWWEGCWSLWLSSSLAPAVRVLAGYEDLLQLTVARLCGRTANLQPAEGGEVWIFLSRLLPAPLRPPACLIPTGVLVLGVFDHRHSHSSGRAWRGSLWAGRLRVVELHQQLEVKNELWSMNNVGPSLTLANILSSSLQGESLGSFVSAVSPSDSWSLLGGVGGRWSSASSSAALLFFMNMLRQAWKWSTVERWEVTGLPWCHRVHCITASLSPGPRSGSVLRSL